MVYLWARGHMNRARFSWSFHKSATVKRLCCSVNKFPFLSFLNVKTNKCWYHLSYKDSVRLRCRHFATNAVYFGSRLSDCIRLIVWRSYQLDGWSASKARCMKLTGGKKENVRNREFLRILRAFDEIRLISSHIGHFLYVPFISPVSCDKTALRAVSFPI